MAGNSVFSWELIKGFLPAALMTLQVTALGISAGLLLGLIFGLLRLARNPLVNAPAKLYIYVIRGTPLLVQLLLLYFGLYHFVKLDQLTSAVVALGVHNGAYIAEIIRGAIQSVDRGQREAGISLGMTGPKVMRRIILPQAVKRAIPPLGNQFIIALKDSSLASAIGVRELLLYSRQQASANAMTLEMMLLASVFYLIMTSILTFLTRTAEKRLQISDHRTS